MSPSIRHSRHSLYTASELSLASRRSQASKLFDFCLSRGAWLIVLPCCQQESSQNSVAALVLLVCYYGAHLGRNFMRVRLEIRYVWQRRIVASCMLAIISLSPLPPPPPPPPPPHTLSLLQSASYKCQVQV